MQPLSEREVVNVSKVAEVRVRFRGTGYGGFSRVLAKLEKRGDVLYHCASAHDDHVNARFVVRHLPQIRLWHGI